MENAFAAQPGAQLLPFHPWIARLNYLLSGMLHRVLPDVSLRIVPGDSYLFVAMSIFDVVYNRASLRRAANKGGGACAFIASIPESPNMTIGRACFPTIQATARFYEAMAGKTLIIGYKPGPVFNELFPADAMVELNPDGSDFAEEIDFFLNLPDEYSRIVDRNYELVMREHTWAARFRRFQEVLQADC